MRISLLAWFRFRQFAVRGLGNWASLGYMEHAIMLRLSASGHDGGEQVIIASLVRLDGLPGGNLAALERTAKADEGQWKRTHEKAMEGREMVQLHLTLPQ